MITCTFEKNYKAKLRHVVVHAIVEKSGSLLLVKRSMDIIEPGKWALPGGFLARDETLKKGVLRELLEETGWEGEIIALFHITSNPNRPHEDRQNVAFSFIIKPTQEVSKPDKESTEVEWVPIEKLPPLDEMAFDHGEIVQLYLKYRKIPFSLPVVI